MMSLNDQIDSSCSVSDTQDYIEYIIKKHETLTTILPIHVYINRINNRLVFKRKKLFGSTNKKKKKKTKEKTEKKYQFLK